ncbi:DUF2844 domain-containing protein [Mycetohabitans sp. B5]|nr:DUF2844 domain-containing protein [Mycetohabitans sp. B5]
MDQSWALRLSKRWARKCVAAYDCNPLEQERGTVVREYIADGTVFGIAWPGPQMPEMRTLLGTYFPQYVSDIQAQRREQGGHGPVWMRSGELVVHSGRHMGDFSGQAFLPRALPAGMTEADIR